MTVKAATAPSTRVLIVAPSAQRRLTLCAMLGKECNLELAESSSAEVEAALRQQHPNVVVMETDRNSADIVGAISESGSAVVLLTDKPDPEWIALLLAAGARAVLRSDAGERQIAAAVQAAAAGLLSLEPETLPLLLRPPLEAVELEPGEEELTPRESEVLRMMTAGLSNREIASTLGISEHTVKFHITSIFGKLGTSSRTEAVTEGLRRGLVLL